MRKLLTALLALAMLCWSGGALADLDLSYFEGKEGVFEVETEEDGGTQYAFITSAFSIPDLSFMHAHESETRYSYARFDLLMSATGGGRCYPRLWMVYCADEPQEITGVTFYVNGQAYTFTGIDDEAWRTSDEKGCKEELLIVFGEENLPFLWDLDALVEGCADADAMREVRITATFHGREDLTVVLSEHFLADYMLVIQDAYMNTDAMATIAHVSATPMTVEAAQTPAPDPVPGQETPPAAPALTEAERVERFLLQVFGLEP